MTLASVWPVATPIETRLPPDPVIASVLYGDRLPDSGAVTRGSAAQRYAGMRQSATVTVVDRANAAQRSGAMSQAASGQANVMGAAEQAYGGGSQQATGGIVLAGSAITVARGAQQVAGGGIIATGSASTVARGMTQAASGTSGSDAVTGTADQTAGGMTQAADGGIVITADADQVGGASSQIASASVRVYGMAAQVAGGVSQVATGRMATLGIGAGLSADMSQNATGIVAAVGSAVQTYGKASQSASGKQASRGSAASTAKGATQSATGVILWTPANGTSTKLIVIEPPTFAWTGTGNTNFNGGTNTGSLGGSFVTASGTPTKAAADANGNDAINLNGGPSFGIAGAALPAGNKVFIFVTKRLGNPPNGIGAIMAQPDGKPGWALYDQINTSGALSNGDAYHPGDKGFNGWGSANFNVDKDIIVTPPTDDGGYNVNVVKVGTATQWNYSGATLTRNYHLESAFPATTGNFYIGTSSGGLAVNERLAYGVVLQGDSSSDEIAKYEGYLARKYGDTLPPGHPYETNPPTVSLI